MSWVAQPRMLRVSRGGSKAGALEKTIINSGFKSAPTCWQCLSPKLPGGAVLPRPVVLKLKEVLFEHALRVASLCNNMKLAQQKQAELLERDS